MRKNLIIFAFLLIVLIFFVSCKTGKEGKVDSNVDFEVGVYYNKDWSNATLTYEGDAIPNKEVALEVASAVFYGFAKDTWQKNHVPSTIFFDEEDEIWIVSFAENDENVIGGDCSIALQKKDGRILRIWFGE